MTLEEAKREAKRRWGALGGWAEEGQTWVWDKQQMGSVPKPEMRVGVYETGDAGGVQRVTWGKGRTFEDAFAAAEEMLARRAEAKPPRQRKPRKGELPQLTFLPPAPPLSRS